MICCKKGKVAKSKKYRFLELRLELVIQYNCNILFADINFSRMLQKKGF